MGNYFDDIVSEADPAVRKRNLDALIAEQAPSEVLVLTILSVVSDDTEIRHRALDRLDERQRDEGNAAARAVSLIESWRREGAIMTWPEPMDPAQKRRAAAVEAAYRARAPLSSAAEDKMAAAEQNSLPSRRPSVERPTAQPSFTFLNEVAKPKPWWKFW